MNPFNVLDRNLILHQHHLLEASAGTGKTFSIQNIVVRLLIESMDLDKILVVTFTRAATRDLKLRIRTNIEQTLAFLNEPFKNLDSPDFIQAIFESGEIAVNQAKRRLQQALFGFDQSQIFTIHSFCSRMLKQYALESDLGLHVNGGENPLPDSEILSIIRDFFRTSLNPQNYSQTQIEIYLSKDPNQKKLLSAIKGTKEFITFPPFDDLYKHFVETIQKLKTIYEITSDQFIADFEHQAPYYKNAKGAESKALVLEKVKRFALLFDKSELSQNDFEVVLLDQMDWVKALDSTLLKKPLPIDLTIYYPGLFAELNKTLKPIVSMAGDFPTLLARLAKDCQEVVRRYQSEEEKLSPDDFLTKMELALNQVEFLKLVQSSYQAAIIDEFQDTDPLQWSIFRQLFLSDIHPWTGHLYLVGDPKQSIYSFRQADIYTYLNAAQTLGSKQCFSLDVNYRSHSNLVQALNALFKTEHIPSFIPLPKLQSDLPYQPVKASSRSIKPLQEDQRGSIHFFIGDGSAIEKAKIDDLDERVFYPFIINEISRLQKKNELKFNQFAVLVKDRFQAAELATYFDQHHIPYINQKGCKLTESPALPTLIELLTAVLHPRDWSAIKTALGGRLLGWTHEEIKALESLESIVLIFQQLRQRLIETGFSLFFQEVLQSHWPTKNGSVQERLMMRKGGLEFLHDLQQLADLIIEHQYQDWNGLEGIIPFLDGLQVWDDDNDQRIARFQDPDKEGVKILTLHSSKGLEFDVVFALGLINRRKITDDLIPMEMDGSRFLMPVDKEAESFILYCEEIDSEKMRQLYVALTRAKKRLYIPVAMGIKSDSVQYGEASPMDLYLARFNQHPANYQEIYERVRGNNCRLISFIDECGKEYDITYTLDSTLPFHVETVTKTTSWDELKIPKTLSVIHDPIIVTSFTGLTQQHHAASIQSAPHQFDHQSKTIHTLPANAETGVLIHSVLERIDFSELMRLQNAQESLGLVKPLIFNHRYRGWEETITDMIFHTLKTSLMVEHGCFCLAELRQDQIYREMPFLFPYENNFLIEDVEFSNGLIKGVIDLIFLHQGRYYILDWKSNWLGASLDDYNQEGMKKAMEDHAYFLQAKIYQEALKRYLRLVDPRPFEECFGGTIYLFLRGMSIGNSTGVYYLKYES